MERYVMKQFDLEPTLQVQLLDGTVPLNLTNAVTATLIVRNRKGVKINAPMTITDQTLTPGVLAYHWQKADTDAAGTYQAEVQLTWPGNRPQTFPGEGYLTIAIVKDLDQAGAA